MDKHEIAHILEEIATLLELRGDNPFKIRAYRSAARQLENITEDFGEIVEEERLTDIQGIGNELAKKITLLYTTGHLPLYDDLKKKVPEGVLMMLQIPGLGAKKVKVIYEKLNIKSISALKKACQQGKVGKLSGFGAKTEQNILEGIQHLEEYSQRHLWWDTMEISEPIVNGLKKLKEVEKVQVAGSVRRRLETIGDLDILVASSKPEPIMDWFTKQEWVASVTAKGSTKSSVRLEEGMQVDLRVVPMEQFPFALHYFTGSKEHNIKLRHRARQRGLTLNEYALSPIEKGVKAPFGRKKHLEEEDIFKALGLPYIPPELRQDMGEIEAAEKGELPHLITEKDIRGVFHNHTTESDGHNTLEEMVRAAEKYGWEYLGIADHSKSSVQANGLDEERVLQQIEVIRKLNKSKKFKTYVFAGIECDILNKGELDLPDEVLKELDYVVVSIHRGFKQDEKTMTQRLIKAIEHPLSTMVGHLTGRLLLRREPYALNERKVIDAAIANGKIIEINAHPQRLDMDWRLWHYAKEKGLMCAINPDAHSTEGLVYYKAGINIARKGWLEKEDVLNTFTLKKVKEYFKRS